MGTTCVAGVRVSRWGVDAGVNPRRLDVMEIRCSTEPAALDAQAAAAYLGVEARWLDDAPLPRVDMRKPGAQRPVWRWRRRDLDRFLHARLVAPGTFSPFA